MLLETAVRRWVLCGHKVIHMAVLQVLSMPNCDPVNVAAEIISPGHIFPMFCLVSQAKV